ncbi:MAG: antitoxin [Verrucomicrobia bacterium]|nr:antitoxin [Verrucomicrobiota bacterium]
MIKTQVQIPDELFECAKKVAATKEWSFAELVRRGLEQMVLRHPDSQSTSSSEWSLPAPVDLGLSADPFADPEWREEANIGSGSARLIAGQLREQAARYEGGT